MDAEYVRLDVLINNAGIASTRLRPVEVGAEEMREVYETNVFGPDDAGISSLATPLGRAPGGDGLQRHGSITITSDPDRIVSRLIGLP